MIEWVTRTPSESQAVLSFSPLGTGAGEEAGTGKRSDATPPGSRPTKDRSHPGGESRPT